MADYGRDMDIGRPDDSLDIKRIAIAVQALADITVDNEDIAAPEEG